MKKILLLISVLALSACARPIEPEELGPNLSIEPLIVEENAPVQWVFSKDGKKYIEDMLLKPVRQAYGISSPDKAFSRCSSSVEYSLQGENEQAVFKEGFYYGTLYIYMGCETGEEYPFRVFMDGSTVQVENEAGEYISVQDWLE